MRVTGTGFDADKPEANEFHWLDSENRTVEIVKAKTATATQLEFYASPLTEIKAGSQKARLLVGKLGFSDMITVDLGSAEATITSVNPSTSPLGGELKDHSE